jgi:hypothetical protein
VQGRRRGAFGAGGVPDSTARRNAGGQSPRQRRRGRLKAALLGDHTMKRDRKSMFRSITTFAVYGVFALAVSAAYLGVANQLTI